MRAVVVQWGAGVAGRPPAPRPAPGDAVLLGARALEATRVDDPDALGRVLDRMWDDPWWGPQLRAAALRAMAAAAQGGVR